jgi:hypothetical protein
VPTRVPSPLQAPVRCFQSNARVERVAQRPSYPSVRTGALRTSNVARVGTGEYSARACLRGCQSLGSYPPDAQPPNTCAMQATGRLRNRDSHDGRLSLGRANPGLKAWRGCTLQTDTNLRGAPDGPRFTVVSTSNVLPMRHTGHWAGPRVPCVTIGLTVKEKRAVPTPSGHGPRSESPRDHAGLGSLVCRAQANWRIGSDPSLSLSAERRPLALT